MSTQVILSVLTVTLLVAVLRHLQPWKYRRIFARRQAREQLDAYLADVNSGRLTYTASRHVRLQERVTSAPRVRKVKR